MQGVTDALFGVFTLGSAVGRVVGCAAVAMFRVWVVATPALPALVVLTRKRQGPARNA